MLLKKLSVLTLTCLVAMGLMNADPATAGIRFPMDESGSDLFLILVNQTTGNTEIISLGFAGTEIGSQKKLRINPNWRRQLGDGELTYQLVAGDVSRQGSLGYSGNVLYTTSAQAITTEKITNIFLMRGLNAIDEFLRAIVSWKRIAELDTFQSLGRTASNWGPTNARPTAPGRTLSIPALDSAAPVDEPLNLYEVTAGAIDDPNDIVSARAVATVRLRRDSLEFVSR